jgi:hypothetical protein
MNTESSAHSGAEFVDEVSKWTVGGGIVTVALFPLALPILVLTAVAVLPLLLPVLAAGVLIGVVALPILLLRGLGRLVVRTRRPRRAVVTGQGRRLRQAKVAHKEI